MIPRALYKLVIAQFGVGTDMKRTSRGILLVLRKRVQPQPGRVDRVVDCDDKRCRRLREEWVCRFGESPESGEKTSRIGCGKMMKERNIGLGNRL